MSKKIINRAPKDIFQQELNSITYEYSVDVFQEGVIKVYLPISLYTTYEVDIDFKNYPNKPLIKYDDTLKTILGTPEGSLHILKKWDPSNPPHIIDIIHELEGLIKSSAVLDKVGEQLSFRYHTIALGPKKVRIILTFDEDKAFTFNVFYDKLPPKIEFDENSSKFIKPSQIRTIANWSENSSIISVVDEIAQKLEHRVRVFYELKDIQPYISGLVQSGASIIFNVRIEIETGEKFDFEFTLPPRYPKKPPQITLISKLDNFNMVQKISDFIQYQKEYWEKNKKLVEILEDLKDLLIKNSEKVCGFCHNFRCPTCNKQLTLGIEGVSGTSECKHICPHCGRKFHAHCWNEVYKLTHQCPICLKNIKRI
ncbi:MAG: hypothetical protein ACTSRP_05875 [Candidatus Helarchaeota archaeon]